MSIKLLIGAALTALISLFSTAPAAIAERLSSIGDRPQEMTGLITAVDADAIRIQLDGGEEVVVRVDEGTEIRPEDPLPKEGVSKLACLGLVRPVDSVVLEDLLAGMMVTVVVEDEGGVIHTRTIRVLPEGCGQTFVPRDGAGTLPSDDGR